MSSSAWNKASDSGPLFIPVVTAIGAVVHISRTRGGAQDMRPKSCWCGVFVRAVGVGGLVVSASHLFFAEATAEQIGFPVGNPFQFEVALANFAFAILSLSSRSGRRRGGCCWRSVPGAGQTPDKVIPYTNLPPQHHTAPGPYAGTAGMVPSASVRPPTALHRRDRPAGADTVGA
jgi:hypothetical protein